MKATMRLFRQKRLRRLFLRHLSRLDATSWTSRDFCFGSIGPSVRVVAENPVYRRTRHHWPTVVTTMTLRIPADPMPNATRPIVSPAPAVGIDKPPNGEMARSRSECDPAEQHRQGADNDYTEQVVDHAQRTRCTRRQGAAYVVDAPRDVLHDDNNSGPPKPHPEEPADPRQCSIWSVVSPWKYTECSKQHRTD